MSKEEIEIAMAKAEHNKKFKKQSGLKALKEYRSQQQGVNVHADEYLEIIEKELKALEIIKEKQIDVLYIFMFPNSLEKYNKHVSYIGNNKWCLSQEDYNLLKEVLL